MAGIPAVGAEDALAAHPVGGGHLRAEDRIADLAFDVAQGHPLVERRQPSLGVAEGAMTRLEQREDRPARRVQQPRAALEALLPVRADAHLAAGQDPRRRALEDAQRRDLALDLGDELDRRGAGADDADAAIGQIVVVVPAGRVERVPGKARESRQGGRGRIAQGADAADEHLGAVRARARLDLPALALVVPRGALHLVAEAHVLDEAVAGRDVAHVLPDLRRRGEQLAPARVLLVGERVEDARDVAGAAGVGVVAPGAAEIVGALEDHEVLDPVALQGDPHRDAAESAADDDHMVVGRRLAVDRRRPRRRRGA